MARTMRRLHPPVHLLQAFATTARFGSISRAAEALHLTQSAVSKQVQELERWTGVARFERVGKRLGGPPAGPRRGSFIPGAPPFNPGAHRPRFCVLALVNERLMRAGKFKDFS